MLYRPRRRWFYNGVHYIRLGNAGRNELIGPGLVNLDFSLFKNITLTEAIHLQFRVEAFNVLNHPNFAAPVDNGQHFILDPTISGIGIVPSNPSDRCDLEGGARFHIDNFEAAAICIKSNLVEQRV